MFNNTLVGHQFIQSKLKVTKTNISLNNIQAQIRFIIIYHQEKYQVTS